MGLTPAALAAFAAASVALAVPALYLQRFLAPPWRALRLLTAILLWVYLVACLVLAAGLVGRLRPGPLLLASMAAAALAAAAWRVWPPPAPPPGTVGRIGLDALAGAALGFTALHLLRLAAHVWLLPPYVYDVLTYHLSNVAAWVAGGAIEVPNEVVSRCAWPAGFELVEAWLAVFPRHDAFVELGGLPFYALAAGSVYSLARSLGLDRAASVVAAAAYACTPAVALHAGSCKNHLPTAALFLFTAALLMAARAGAAALPRTGLLLCVCAGFGAAMKPVAAILPGLALLAWPAVRRETPAAAAGTRVPLPLAAFLVLSAAALAAYWYVRNLMLYGSPFYPTDLRIFGRLLAGDGNGIVVGGYSWHSLAVNLGRLPGRLLDAQGPYNVDLNGMAGWGWLATACGLPSLAYALVHVRALRPIAAAFLLSFLSLMAWITTDPYNMRHALWFAALPALAFAAAMAHLRPGPRRALGALAAVCAVLDLAGTLDGGRLAAADFARMWRLPPAARSSAELGLYMGPRYRRALQAAGGAVPLGYHLHTNGWLYPLYGPDFSRRHRFVPLGPGRDPVTDMRLAGVELLFVPVPAASRRGVAAAQAAVARGELVLVGEDLYAIAPR